jgi:hypothetical protein
MLQDTTKLHPTLFKIMTKVIPAHSDEGERCKALDRGTWPAPEQFRQRLMARIDASEKE